MFDATSPSDLTHDLTPFGSPEVRGGTPSDNDLQRAEGFGRALLSGSEKGSRIVDIFQRSPIRIMFPGAGGGAVEEAVLVNTAGGIAGGDRLECGVTALANASIAVTSQAAEKIYRALNEPARIATKLKACEAAKLAWLPQETIVFNWGRLSRETEIEVSSGAELLALEWLVLGRAAHGEEMVGGHIADSWRVKKDGRLIWADSFRATGGRVEQGNFDTYQLLRINETPVIEVHIVQSSEPPGGMGEPGTSAIVPAITNAVFAATGKRLRKLPVDAAQLKPA
ncbi:MAG TPA: urease accessory protein UreD [Vicinamibacterales bacterium]|nr:urease accessory protein UreD [Vicinamibacterales bacterium]